MNSTKKLFHEKSFFHLGHGATVIQRRRDGSVNFDQTWEKYENGFGDFQGETQYSLFSRDAKRHYPSNVEKFILNCHILNDVVLIMIITFAVL